MGKIKAVIFDMDGVLIDARQWHYEALNMALEPFGVSIGLESHLLTFDGLSTRQKLKILTKTHSIPEGIHDLINDLKQKHTLEIIYNNCRPVFQHRYLLSRLKREGYHLALCSNSVEQSVKVMTECSGLADLLEFTLSNEDVKKPKPDPEIYTKAMKRFNLSPEECLIVEDNENGIASARASGGHVLCVKDPSDVNYKRLSKALDVLNKGGRL